ncbi:MAG: hypothetical protein FJ333_06710 [Sphingomonadales bacterium]|nr:hypothetical protein [Sphingomonadales bacterium]
MDREKRQLVHEYAELFGCESEVKPLIRPYFNPYLGTLAQIHTWTPKSENCSPTDTMNDQNVGSESYGIRYRYFNFYHRYRYWCRYCLSRKVKIIPEN